MSQPPRVPPEKGHARNKSSTTKSSRPRSATKGPLDADESVAPTVLAGPTELPALSNDIMASPSPHGASSARSRHATASPAPRVGEARSRDFSFLLRRDIYHPITSLNVPLAFRNSPKQPDAAAPLSLELLLERGHFRVAAKAAAEQLTGGGVDPQDAETIFRLLYTRLACLTLIDATPLAAQEVKALEDLNNVSVYVDETTGEHLVPWELRVLNVRLQALGFGDARRAIMSYHELAREARDHAAKAASHSARELWKARLHELGIRVAGALIEMDDPAGAAHHLDSLRDAGDGKLALAKALLWLHLGASDRARDCARQCCRDDDAAAGADKAVMALCDMADADYEAALGRWRALGDSLEGVDEMVGVNTAVCLLYLGKMHEGREVLQGLIGAGLSSHTLLFNLATMYELCSDKHRQLKLELAAQVARMDESPEGWEKTNADFKL